MTDDVPGGPAVDRVLRLWVGYLPPHLRRLRPGPNLGNLSGIYARILPEHGWMLQCLPNPEDLLDREDLCRDHVTVMRIMRAARSHRCDWVLFVIDNTEQEVRQPTSGDGPRLPTWPRSPHEDDGWAPPKLDEPDPGPEDEPAE